MNEKQIIRTCNIFILVSVLLLVISLLSKISIVVNNWANDLVEPITVYFNTLMLWYALFRRPAPRIVCFLAGVGSGLFFEFLQLYQVQIFYIPKGTFDPVDIAMFLIGGLVALVIDALLIKRAHQE